MAVCLLGGWEGGSVVWWGLQKAARSDSLILGCGGFRHQDGAPLYNIQLTTVNITATRGCWGGARYDPTHAGMTW